MCRNDDHNLAQSSILKQLGTPSSAGAPKKKSENKDKLIADLKSREDERQQRENEIVKDLTSLNKSFAALSSQGVDKHLKKMVRKCLMLTVE